MTYMQMKLGTQPHTGSSMDPNYIILIHDLLKFMSYISTMSEGHPLNEGSSHGCPNGNCQYIFDPKLSIKDWSKVLLGSSTVATGTT